jgi:hypothetical protein
MDITKKVLEVSPSAERMLRMLRRHCVEVVICRRDAGLQQACPSVHENSRDLVHPNGTSGSNRGSLKPQPTVMERVRNEYSFDSSQSQCWTKADTLSVKELFKERGCILSSVSRQTDLIVRPVGMVNPEYAGTLVAAQVYNSNSCNTVLVVAKWNLFQPAYVNVFKEISDFLKRNRRSSDELYIMSRNSLNQWILEKVR